MGQLGGQNKENQDSDRIANSRSKKKGSRELEGLRNTINYDKCRSQAKSERRFIRGSRRSQGVMLSYK